VHVVGFYCVKFITMHRHINVKFVFCACDADTLVFCANCASDFLGGVSSLQVAPVSSRFSSEHIFCMFSYCPEQNLLLENLSHIYKVLPCLEEVQQETFI